MKYRLAWTAIGLTVLSLGFWGLGYLEGKYAADKWYRDHTITVWVYDRRIGPSIKANCVTGCADLDWHQGTPGTIDVPLLKRGKPWR